MIYLLTFLLTNLFGYWFHWYLHQPFAGKLYAMHQYHHNVLYPPNDYKSYMYRSPGSNNTVYLFILPALLMLSIPIYFHMWFVVIEMLFIGWLHNYLHDSFHTVNWMNRFSIYRRWDVLHLNHHINQSTNFGIFFFLFDRLFGTINDNE